VYQILTVFSCTVFQKFCFCGIFHAKKANSELRGCGEYLGFIHFHDKFRPNVDQSSARGRTAGRDGAQAGG
jgi:hypothetical protein